MGDQTRGCRFAVCAGYRDYRNSRGRARWKEHVNHMLGNVAAYAFARGEVHTESGSGVYLDYSTSVFTKRFADIWSDDIHARHVETDDPGNSLKEKDVFRMHLVRAIDRCTAGRDVGGRLEMQNLPFL